MKKNAIVISVIGMLLLSSFMIAPAFGYAVKPYEPGIGTILYVGGGGPDNYTSIQAAIDVATPGDTVFVYDDSSPYYENIAINKTIDLIGENRDTTVIDGGGIGNTVEIIADNVNISGFTVRHPGPIANSLYYFGEADSYWNIIGDYFNSRFSPEGSCKLTTCALCLYDYGSIVNTNEGINITVWDDNGNGYPGVERARINVPATDIVWYPEWTVVDFSPYNLIFTDDFHVGYSIVNKTVDYYSPLSDNGTFGINRSSYYDEGWYPLEDEYGNGNYNFLIIANVAFSGIGINITNSDYSIINNSLITRCEKGIVIHDSCDNNKIYHNNFITNVQNALDDGTNIWYDIYPSGGNYWDDYTGVDNYQGPNQNISGQDGIGDTPYVIPGDGNQDYYPLMNPYGEGGSTITISITGESPANNSLDVSRYKQNVSVIISIIQLTAYNVNFTFAWEIGGDNITTTTNPSDYTEGRKEASINGTLQYDTVYHWYVNVSAGGISKRVNFSFTTEEPPNQPPVADFTFTIRDLTVFYDASSSNDTDGNITSYEWNFGDGATATGKITNHTYVTNGIYEVNLTTTDEDGAKNSKKVSINVTNNPPVAKFTYAVLGGTNKVRFDASTSYDVNGTIVSYFWEFGDDKNGTDIIVEHAYDNDYTTYKVNLTVTDSTGASSTTSIEVPIADITNPTIKIVKPVKKGIYINNVYKRQRLLGMALIIGDITIEVNASDGNGSGIKEVKFYGGLRGTRYLGNDTTEPYTFNWPKGFRLIHINQLVVKAYDKEGNSAVAKITLRKYL